MKADERLFLFFSRSCYNLIMEKKQIFNIIKFPYFLLGLILILAFCLQIFRLSAESFWMDEIYTIQAAEMPTGTMLSEILKQNHSPLYFLFIKAWLFIFGDSEFFLRFPSVIFGVLVVFLTFLVGRELFGREIGLLSAFFVAIHPMIIEYAQEGRMYTLLTAFVLCSVYFMLKMEKSGFQKFKTFFIVATSAALYTHAYANFYFIAVFFYLFLKYFRKSIFNKALVVVIIPAVFYAPYFFALFLQILYPDKYSPILMWEKVPLNIALVKYLFVRSDIATYSNPDPQFYLLPSIILILFLLYSVYSVLNIQDKTKISYLTFLYLWLFLPLLIPFAVSVFWKRIFSIHYAIFIIPALYIIISWAMWRFPYNKLRLPRIHSITVLLVIVSFFVSLNLKDFYSQYHKPPWRLVADYIRENKNKAEAVVLFEEAGAVPDVIKHYRPGLPILRSFDLKPEQVKGRDIFLVSLGQIDEKMISEEALSILDQRLAGQLSIDRIWIYHLMRSKTKDEK